MRFLNVEHYSPNSPLVLIRVEENGVEHLARYDTGKDILIDAPFGTSTAIRDAVRAYAHSMDDMAVPRLRQLVYEQANMLRALRGYLPKNPATEGTHAAIADLEQRAKDEGKS